MGLPHALSQRVVVVEFVEEPVADEVFGSLREAWRRCRPRRYRDDPPVGDRASPLAGSYRHPLVACVTAMQAAGKVQAVTGTLRAADVRRRQRSADGVP